MKSLRKLVLWRLGFVRIEPWADAGETDRLVAHARGKKRLAEIGVWEGGTTKHLRRAMAPEGVIFAIDPFPVGSLGISYQLPIAHGEVAGVRNGSVIWLRMTSADAARDPRVTAAPFDFVFIDGEHSYAGLQRDWELWSPQVAGVVALHDVIGDPGQGSVRCARERIFTDPRFQLLETVGGLAILARR